MSKFNIQIDGKLKSTTKGNEIWWYGGGSEAWGSLANAKAGVPLAIRSGKTVGVLEDNKIVEYIWYPNDTSDNGLVLKQDALPDNVAFTDVENNFTENQTFKEATFERVFSNNEATANNELVRLDQLNSAVSGLNWQDPIDDILDLTISEPTFPTIGDRYINSGNGTSSVTGQSVTKDNIYEWDGSDWADFTPLDGWTVFDRAVDQNFTFNGTSWVEFGSTVSHNNTTGLQGGQAGQYYHLTEAQYLSLSGGIDADNLNGQNGAYYLNYNNFSNVPDLSGFLVAADLNPYAKLSGGNEFSGTQIISGNVEVKGDFTKILLNGTQSGGQQFSISNHIPGVSNIGFSIRNENSGTNVLSINSSNNSTFSGVVNMGNASSIVGSGSGASNASYLEFKESNGTTSQGYVGFGSSSNSDLYVFNFISGKALKLKENGVLDYNGNATFSGNVDASGTVQGSNLISTTDLTSVGIGSATSNTGSNVSSFGVDSAQENTGANLSSFGYLSAKLNIGSNVSAFGYASAQSNTGNNVSAFGHSSAKESTGTNVSAFGYISSLTNIGSNVSSFGYASAQSNTGNNVSAFGMLSAQSNTFNNVSAFGYNAQPTKDNQVMLGDTNVVEVFTYGNFVGSGANFSGDVQIDGFFRTYKNALFYSQANDRQRLTIDNNDENVSKIYYFRETFSQFKSINIGGSSSSDNGLTIDGTGNATFSGDINLSAGKKLQFSANSFMTPENNSTGAEISTAGDFRVKTGGTPTLGLLIDGSQKATFSGDVEVNGSLKIKSNSTPIVFEETNYTGVGKYWRQVLDDGNLRFDYDTTGNGSFSQYFSSFALDKYGNAFFSGTVEVANTNGGVLNLKSTDTNLVLDQLIGGLTFEASNAIVGGIRMKKNTVINDPNGLGSRLDFSVGSVSGYDVMALSLTSTKATFSVDIQAQGYKSADGSEGMTTTFNGVIYKNGLAVGTSV